MKKKYDYFQDEFDKETRNEMNEWARLVDKYGSELKKFDMICFQYFDMSLIDGINILIVVNIVFQFILLLLNLIFLVH